MYLRWRRGIQRRNGVPCCVWEKPIERRIASLACIKMHIDREGGVSLRSCKLVTARHEAHEAVISHRKLIGTTMLVRGLSMTMQPSSKQTHLRREICMLR